jgi:hypothetical protein
MFATGGREDMFCQNPPLAPQTAATLLTPARHGQTYRNSLTRELPVNTTGSYMLTMQLAAQSHRPEAQAQAAAAAFSLAVVTGRNTI